MGKSTILMVFTRKDGEFSMGYLRFREGTNFENMFHQPAASISNLQNPRIFENET